MSGLTTDLLARACRIFLALAYPGGEATVPGAKRAFLHIEPSDPLDAWLAPPVCQSLAAAGGGVRGYMWRLGSAAFPHLKLQAVSCNREDCVFAVDTHDAIQIDPGHPDAARWAQLQAANRRLKAQIERAWEAEGLLTFNALLRREVERSV
jgi:hypothetical protein